MNRKAWGILFIICAVIAIACDDPVDTPGGGGPAEGQGDGKPPKVASCVDGDDIPEVGCEGYKFTVKATIKGPSSSWVKIRTDHLKPGRWRYIETRTPVDVARFVNYRPDQEIHLEAEVEKDGAPGAIICTIHKIGGSNDDALIDSVMHGSQLITLKGTGEGPGVHRGCTKPKGV